MATSTIQKDDNLFVERVAYEHSVTIAGRSYTTITVNVAKDGFTPIAILNLASYGTEVFSMGNVNIPASGNAQVMIWNNYSDSRTATAVVFRVLYRKA